MEAVREYGFINAKVRAMRSRFLPESTIRSLAGARDSRELVSGLGQTRYRDALAQADTLAPEALEWALDREEVRQLRIVEKYSKGDSRELVRTLLERYDAERLKAVLRLWHTGKKEADEALHESAAVAFPVDALLSAQSIAQAASLLAGTPFEKPVSESAAAYEERKTLFPVELAVDRHLFSRIWKAGMALNAADRSIVRRLVGIEIDLKNLDWLSRFRNYYKISFAEISDLLLPHGSRLDAESLGKMASEGRLSDAAFRVARGTAVHPPEGEAAAPASEAMERFLSHALLYEARRAFRLNPLSVGSILGYFYCLRIESRNLKTLFTGKRYGLPPQQLEPFLIL
jgi:vacuolar-type H+-ATPase subunit C/Vma6